ncbi:MAG: hypothetical protein DMG06_14865 [Acidobacteria bacterium]|nr:MAG: hypothetical protein DMG06_14865 [Acidobacteriota bacterium]
MTELPPLLRDQRRIDAEHLKLLSIFHFVLSGTPCDFQHSDEKSQDERDTHTIRESNFGEPFGKSRRYVGMMKEYLGSFFEKGVDNQPVGLFIPFRDGNSS